MSSTQTGLTLEPRVIARMLVVAEYVEDMRRERLGYGPAAMAEADQTAHSYLRAVSYLLRAREVWIDGGDPSLSFGGIMDGGIVFGMIARREASMNPDAAYPPIAWTVHS